MGWSIQSLANTNLINQLVMFIFIFIILKCFRCLNKEKLSELLENLVLCKPTQICVANYKLDEIVIVLNNVSLKRATVDIFCKKFNIKLVKSILYVDYYLF